MQGFLLPIRPLWCPNGFMFISKKEKLEIENKLNILASELKAVASTFDKINSQIASVSTHLKETDGRFPVYAEALAELSQIVEKNNIFTDIRFKELYEHLDVKRVVKKSKGNLEAK